jgi:hypothetical protein
MVEQEEKENFSMLAVKYNWSELFSLWFSIKCIQYGRLLQTKQTEIYRNTKGRNQKPQGW